MEVVQLAPHVCRAVALCSTFPSHRVLRLQAGSELAVRGVVRKGDCCMLLSGSAQIPVRSFGHDLGPDELILAGPGVRLDLFVRSGASLFVLIAASGESMPRTMTQVNASADAELADARLVARYFKEPEQCAAGFDPASGSRLSRLIAASTHVQIDRLARTPRVTAVVCACRLVEEHFPAAPSLHELSRHCGVAERTLEYGFRHVYGTTPLRFIRSLRLTRSRSALLHPKNSTSISATARALGFTHMGQYCRDYRRLFGETPSMTLARRKVLRRLVTL